MASKAPPTLKPVPEGTAAVTAADSNTAHQAVGGDDDVDDDYEINYSSTDYILRNLSIIDNLKQDPTFTLQTREMSAAHVITSQLCFYTHCLLRAFSLISHHTTTPPIILVIGSGFVGSKYISKLYEYGLGPLLYVYCRSDITAKYWINKGIRASNSIHKLLKKNKIDMLVLNTPSMAFSAIAAVVKPYLTEATAVLSASLGLSRRRIYSSLKTITVFRTYCETAKVQERLKRDALNKDFADDQTNDDSSVPSASAFSHSAIGDGVSWAEQAAEFVLDRTGDICYLVFQVENFYALKGVGHPQARREAIAALLGSHSLPSSPTKSSTDAQSSSSQGGKTVNFQASLLKDKHAPVRIALLNKVATALQNSISVNYQIIFSRYIRVVDLPKIEDLSDVLGHGSDPNIEAFKEKAPPSYFELMERKRRNPTGGDVQDDEVDDTVIGAPIHAAEMLLLLFDHDDKLARGDEGVLSLLAEADEDSDLDDDDDRSLPSIGDGFDAFLDTERVVPPGAMPGGHLVLYPEEDLELVASPRTNITADGIATHTETGDSALALGGLFNIPVGDSGIAASPPKSTLILKKKGSKFSADAKKILSSNKSNKIQSPKMIICGNVGVHAIKKMRDLKSGDIEDREAIDDGIARIESRDLFDDEDVGGDASEQPLAALQHRGQLQTPPLSSLLSSSGGSSPAAQHRMIYRFDNSSVPSLVISSRSAVTEAFGDNSVQITSKSPRSPRSSSSINKDVTFEQQERAVDEISRKIETIREEASRVD